MYLYRKSILERRIKTSSISLGSQIAILYDRYAKFRLSNTIVINCYYTMEQKSLLSNIVPLVRWI